MLGDPQNHANNFMLDSSRALSLYLPALNVGQSQMAGLDLAWQVRRPLDWGLMTLGLSATRVLMSRYRWTDDEPFVSDLNRYSPSSTVVTPKWRARMQLGLQQPEWQWQATLNYVGAHDGGPVDVIAADTGGLSTLPSFDVPAWWTVDAMVAYQWSPKTTMRLGIENVFNRKPPLDFSWASGASFGINPMMANVWGRVLNVSLTHRF